MASETILSEWQPSQILLIGFIIFVGLVILALNCLSLKLDPLEPPLLKPSIPLIGHIIGLLRHGVDYFSILGLVSIDPQVLKSAYEHNKS